MVCSRGLELPHQPLACTQSSEPLPAHSCLWLICLKQPLKVKRVRTLILFGQIRKLQFPEVIQFAGAMLEPELPASPTA